jgi:TonB-linked SusC/RagA family outer membrane protein
MKLSFLPALAGVMLMLTTIEAGAQNTEIHLPTSKLSVEQLLKEIEAQTNYLIIFSNREIDVKKEITLSETTGSVSDLLTQVFAGSGIHYEFEKDYIILSKLVPETARIPASVSGTIIDANGDPVPGANVLEKGTFNATTTDIDGKFTIKVAGDKSVLQFSFLGFVTQEVAVGNQTALSILLAEDTRTLEEVVVVGYGTMRKSLVTGAISSVKGSSLEQVGIMRADDALAGKTAGVQIISNSGQPGAGIDIRIRGVGTNGDAQPIYIVDGMTVGGLEYLNTADIESIEILKDAAAAAIYGARGGNGVVLITTKKGSEGNAYVSYNFSYGIQNIQRKIDVLNAKEYAIIQNEAAINGGNPAPFTQEQINSFDKGTDWQEALLYRNAPTMQHNLTFSGGSPRSVYNASFSYFDQDGILAKGKSNFKRYTASLNAEQKFFKDNILTVGETIVVSRVERQSVTQNSNVAGPLVGALNMDPLTPVYDSYQTDPLYGGFGTSRYVSQEVVNPVARIFFSHGRSYYTTVKGNTYAELKFLNDFKLRGTAGVDITWNGSYGYTPLYKLNSTTGNTTDNGASQAMDEYRNLNFEALLSWAHTYGKHDVSAMAGTELIQRSGTFISGNRNDLLIDNADYAYLSMAKAINPGVSGGVSDPSAVLSFFARANYAYDNRYIMTATIRRDGSSRFGTNYRFATFPSVSVGWNVSNEEFMQPAADILNILKLRASWGQNGNENISNFRYLSTISTYGLGYPFGSQLSDGALSVGAAPVRVPNPDLQWEASEQFNVGLDATVFNNLSLTVDYYIKTTKALLVTSPIPLFLGNDFPVMNAGTVRNSGIEIAASFNKNIGKVSISVDGNIAFNKNEVTYVGSYTKFVDGTTVQGFSGAITRMEEGHPMAYFRGYQTEGIFQNWDEINSYTYTNPETGAVSLIQPNAKPGDFRFRDNDNNGVIDDSDRTNIGDPYPAAIFGFNLNVGYANFDLGINTSGTAGSKIFSVLRRVDLPMSNYGSWALDRWHGEGTSNTIPRVTQNDLNQSWSRPSDFYVMDGSFWRIRNVTLGYTIKVPPHYYIQKIRIFGAVSNLYTFTKYRGYDPEIGGGVLSVGIDRGIYPRPRILSFGVNLFFQ